MLDVDHFKRFNDTYGHLLGDKVLKLIGRVLKASVKGKDLAARFGGEEFAILLPDTPLSGALSLAESIRKAIEKSKIKRMDTGEAIGNITISIGAARYHSGESINSLIDRSDAALYLSKKQGRNRVTSEEQLKKAG